MTAIAKGLVIYTDGSSVPHQNQHGAGFGGSGIHGYFFHTCQEKERPTKFGKWTVTSSGYVLKPTPGHTPVVIDQFIDAVLNISGASVTNNYAEMFAALFALNLAMKDDSLESLIILADSQLVVNGIDTWMYDWARNGWKTRDGREVKNREIWESIYSTALAVKEKLSFSIEWVRGHNDDLGNSFADYNAGVASQTSVNRVAGVDSPHVIHYEDNVKEYIDSETELHPFLNQKRVYFNSCPDYNEPGIYYQTSWAGQEKDFILGKRTGETSYSVVALTSPDEIMETIIRRGKNQSEHNIVMYAKMDRVKNAVIGRYIQRYGSNAFIDDLRNKNVNFVDRQPVIHACRPGELPLRAFDTLQYLRSILGKVVRNDLQESEEKFQLFDITDVLYEKVIKKSKQTEIEVMSLRKEFGVGFTLLNVQKEVYGHVVDFKVYFGDDLPARNQMKRIEVLNPMIQLVVWRETTHFLRYACVITTDDAHGIWSNYFSNQVVLKPK